MGWCASFRNIVRTALSLLHTLTAASKSEISLLSLSSVSESLESLKSLPDDILAGKITKCDYVLMRMLE